MKGITQAGERKEMVEALLHQTNLWAFRKKALSTYSGGMKQRFGIAPATAKETAGPFTTLPRISRSKLRRFCGRTNETETFVREPGRTADPSAALGMTKGRP
jgi:ABC-type nitrate/sulfonate/bicarbonate transport system ATPase subunit